jgi:hypothetical protein
MENACLRVVYKIVFTLCSMISAGCDELCSGSFMPALHERQDI